MSKKNLGFGLTLPNGDIRLTLEEAAEIALCSTTTLRRRAQEGKIPKYNVGRRLMFKYSELMDFINSTGSNQEQNNQNAA